MRQQACPNLARLFHAAMIPDCPECQNRSQYPDELVALALLGT